MAFRGRTGPGSFLDGGDCRITGAGALGLRFTFIDMDDYNEQNDAPGSAGRATSCPPSLGPTERCMEASGLFQGELEYVAELSQRMNFYWGATEEAETSTGELGAGSAAAIYRPLAAPGISRRHVSDIDPVVQSATTAGTAEEGCSSQESRMRGVDLEPPSAADLWPGTAAAASVGHPYLCERPCIYFASGTCANGNACTFCHLPHSRKPGHLAKKHRERLQALPQSVATSVTLSVLQAKVVALSPSAETSAALAACRRSVAAAGGGLASRGSRPDAALTQALASLTLRFVLTALQRSAARNDPDVDAAAEELLWCLRMDTLRSSSSSSSASSAV
eukprot:CAMPEP_0176120316 /NCGR_PEP_ID=MMETSP0120_2-20121206/60518_1 /TAXON_ID=160619 /ORGANISM="Kryptoperidinium foliaceum, Strain CCMP 1326" /LENGTH=334 /DNA_ID=CAMNT_0017454769 /DNA_START=85 /DNA_END=1091 /DNA_ORIENTATION=+